MTTLMSRRESSAAAAAVNGVYRFFTHPARSFAAFLHGRDAVLSVRCPPEMPIPLSHARGGRLLNPRVVRDLLIGAGIVAAATTLAAQLAFDPDSMADAAMLYLLGVVVASLRLGAGPSLATALLSVVVFDFIFIPPHLGFVMTDFRHLVTFAVMLFVAVVINRLARRMRDHVEEAAARERRTAALCDMSRDLVAAVERPTLVAAAARHIGAVFEAEVVVLAPEASAPSADERANGRPGSALVAVHRTAGVPQGPAESAAADWVFRRGQDAGLGARAFPQAMGLYLPVVALHERMGVVGVFPRDRRRFEHPEERRVLDAFVVHVGVALERALMAAEAERVRLSAESERLRNALLSSVSHDLRTPLGAIEGASSTLVTLGAHLDEPTRQELAETIHEGAQKMARRVSNLLDMTRLEAGAIRPRQEWQPLEEVLGSALHQLDQALAGREVTTDLPETLPPLRIDSVLVGQVLVNILENAVKYSPPGSPLEVAVAPAGAGEVVVSVADRGPGIPAGHESRIFDKFHRASADGAASGVGLGLAICRAIVRAHGGRIWAENRAEGGAVFKLTLPTGDNPPDMPSKPAVSAP
jgi:two-component system sensor histidine kinase KdpD